MNDNNPRTDIFASFLVTGFTCSHDEVTEAVGVVPSVTWFKGDKVQGTSVVRNSSGWRLSSDLPKDASLNSHAGRLVEMIYPKAISVSNLKPHGIWLSAAVYVYDGDRPSLRVVPDVISRLADMGAGIDIDLYIL